VSHSAKTAESEDTQHFHIVCKDLSVSSTTVLTKPSITINLPSVARLISKQILYDSKQDRVNYTLIPSNV